MITYEIIKQMVVECSTELDSTVPGWENKIDLAKLNLAVPNCCIIGHLYGDYNTCKEPIKTSHTAALGGMLNSKSLKAYTEDEKFVMMGQLYYLWAEQIVYRRQLARKELEQRLFATCGLTRVEQEQQ